MQHTVDVHLGVADNLLDLALLLEVSKSLAGQAAVDLQTVDEGGDGDETVGLDILVKSLGSLLLEDNGVLGLVLDCRREGKKKTLVTCYPDYSDSHRRVDSNSLSNSLPKKQ